MILLQIVQFGVIFQSANISNGIAKFGILRNSLQSQLHGAIFPSDVQELWPLLDAAGH
jgi:hypothetical protein